MAKLMLFLAGVLGIYFQDQIKMEYYGYVAKDYASSQLESACRDAASCQDALAKESETCVTSAAYIGTKQGETAMKNKLVPCIQKIVRKRACRSDDRCLAGIEASFPMCAATSYPAGADPEDPQRKVSFDNCMLGR